ncbi:phospholipid N-methyltransferase [Bradyrhizobium japonicum]|uniref:DUF3560 domain-containing protein n=1 Tax=Bradyrhizobium liaoningense TaxID=43992 RepID=UPI0004BAF2F6|nr:DUF3560 domain-containing protein [Bradyrhizobium liaoningense]MBR0998791.1 DUF3560 domain-containing protein [Bradyrhizobium liaoningense]MBR1030071.1 DUF3560 domain-containing protein [Bradyrhizobium liaoningense]
MQHSATYSPDDNKLRLYPAHRLDAEEYARVKAAGFKWAPRQELFVKPSWSPEAEDLLTELAGEIGDEDTSLVDRAEQRADRFEDYSEKRMADAERARKAVAEIADNIPFGQPILVGHHSEKHARRDKEKIDAGMRKAVQMWRTSQYWTARAEGAIRHAKYKELPAVRHRRIKTIEADKRKLEKSMAENEKQLKAWRIVAGIADPEKQRATGLAVANVGGYWSMSFPLADYPRDPPASQYEGPMGLWSAIEGNVITAAQAAAIAIPGLERSFPRKARWIAHYDNRLAYERAMLAEQIGTEATANPLADRFPFAVGGQVQVSRYDDWLTILKVNRGANGSVSSITTTGIRNKQARWRVESVRDYQSPSAEDVAAAKAAAKLPPLCNYPGEGFAHLTQAEYDKIPKDYRGYRPRAATETVGAHRTRSAIGAYAFRGKCEDNKRHSYGPVFITDAKRVDPPTIAPPSEPAEPAEFVREFVARPDADLDAALSLVSEIMGEPQDAAEPAATLAPVAPAPRPVLVEALDSLPATADLPAASPTADFEAMRAMLKGGGVQVVVAPQLFPTSPELAAEVAELADIRPGHRILEPSAGTGALIEAARVHGAGSLDIVAIEINHQVAQALGRSQQGVTIINADFMDMAGAVDKFDRIIMNPPFERGADIQHIEHARKFLKPGGRLVAICANGPRQRDKLMPIASEWRDLPAGSFKHAGTSVNTALLVIEGPPG